MTASRALPPGWGAGVELSDADRRLGALLATYGPRGIYPGIPELARQLGCSERWTQKRLRRLEALGLVRRESTYKRPDDPNWKPRGKPIDHFGAQDTNTYWLVPPAPTPVNTPDAVSTAEPAAQTPVNSHSASAEVFTPKTAIHTPVVGDGVGSGERDEFTGVESEVWPAYADFRYYSGPGRLALPPAPRGDPHWVEASVPKRDQLDHDPNASEVLDTLRAGGLGDAEVIDVRKHPTYRNSYGRTIDLETATPAALHGAYKDLLYGNGKRKRKAKPEGEP